MQSAMECWIMAEKMFSQSQLQSIADALADTTDGLTGSEIGHLLATCHIDDPTPDLTKRHRLYNAFVAGQNHAQNRRAILQFIRQALRPELYTRSSDRFEPMRENLNRALAFAGLTVDASGNLSTAEMATTLSEAQRRATELRADLELRGVHQDVLRFCREELVADNYFHAVLEAVKSVADKMQSRTGLNDDGAVLVDHTLAGDPPILAINSLRTGRSGKRTLRICCLLYRLSTAGLTPRTNRPGFRPKFTIFGGGENLGPLPRRRL
jgi:hypothetical protein